MPPATVRSRPAGVVGVCGDSWCRGHVGNLAHGSVGVAARRSPRIAQYR